METDAQFTTEPRVIPRSEHPISRANISPNALKVLYRLRAAGYRACLVGGGVRDLLLGREPKDFDLGTDARPEDVHRLFRNCRLIGRRFRLAHVHFGQEIIEVATFRARQAPEEEDDDTGVLLENGRIIRDNVYGTIEEDAWRRDFTINALYYDIETFAVLDYVGAMADLEAGVVRLIGEPEQRYREDPVRMLRALRFVAKLGLRMHPETEAPIYHLGHLLRDVPPARLFDEVLKLFLGGHAVATFELLRLYGLFRHLFPPTDRCLSRQLRGFPRMLVVRALASTDARIAEGKPVTPAFLFAALLWEPVRSRMAALVSSGESESQALQQAADEVIQAQVGYIAIPRRISLPVREIWALQVRLQVCSGKRPLRLLEHPRFRAAYDFLLLRAEAGEEVAELATWWTRLQALDPQAQAEAVLAGKRSPVRRRSRARRGGGASGAREQPG